MGAKAKTDASALFWRTAAALMSHPDVSEGTLMGFPCLRVGGGFFATCDGEYTSQPPLYQSLECGVPSSGVRVRLF